MSGQVAVWYWRYQTANVTVGDADWVIPMVAGMDEDGECSPAGVQYPDGTYNSWLDDPLVAAERERRAASYKAEMEAARNRPPVPTRKVVAPFTGRDGREVIVTVPAPTPAWVGAS